MHSFKISSLSNLIITITIFICYSSYTFAFSPVEIAKIAKPATVGVYATVNDDKYYGTGVIISSDGIILTSSTVVPIDSNKITVYFEDHTSVNAKIIESSKKSQSVLLKIENNSNKIFPSLALNKKIPELTSPVYTLGNANNTIKLGDGVSFSAGIISGLYKIPINISTSVKKQEIQVIETDAAVNDGQDGGALINNNGEIIGIISKYYSKMRWQGTAIPIQTILNDLNFFKNSSKVTITDNIVTSKTTSLKKAAEIIKSNLVKININRLYPPEILDFPEWNNYKSNISGWNKLSASEQRRIIVDFFSTESLILANQMLRRPGDSVTGLVISKDGYIITSAFNVESSDIVFIDKKSKSLKTTNYDGSIENLLNSYQINIEKVANRVISIFVTLSDGTEVPASIIGFSTPLGLALLKADTSTVPSHYNINANLSSPVLGEDVAVIGITDDSYTINTGIISASLRDNGNYFQFDALLNYGNSGGPIINSNGDFLGLAARPLTPSPISGCILPFNKNKASNNLLPTLKDFTTTPNSGISMGIMGNKIIEMLPELTNGNGINQDDFISLGISSAKNDPYSSKIIIGKVNPNSPASKAGFKIGDEILEMDGIGIRSWTEINNYIAQKKSGQVVIFSIKRPLDKPHLLLNGKKISTAEEFYDFIKNNKDGKKIVGHIAKPGVNQKLYVTL